MRDYDAHLKAQYGPDLDGEEEEFLYRCNDPWCDGHALPNQTCADEEEE